MDLRFLKFWGTCKVAIFFVRPCMAPKLSEHLGKHYRELILAVNNIPSILGDDVGPTAAMRTNHAVQNGTKNQRYSCDTRPAKCRFFFESMYGSKTFRTPRKTFWGAPSSCE